MPIFVVAYDRDQEKTLALDEFPDEQVDPAADRLAQLVAEHAGNASVEAEALIGESKEAFLRAFPAYRDGLQDGKNNTTQATS